MMPATVMRQVFLGSSRDYMVEAADGTQMRVVASAAENVPQGASVWLHLPPERCRVLSWIRAEDPTDRNSYGRRAMMKMPKFSRRDILQGSGRVAARRIRILRPGSWRRRRRRPRSRPELIAAAKKEGKLAYYTSIDLPIAEKIAKAFEAKFPGISVQVERTGAERVFQRIGQEYGSNIHAVDAVNSSDASHFIVWKRDGILQPFVPEDVAKHYKPEQSDPDGQFASFRVGVIPIGYNTNLVKKEDAPKSYADLLDPKWKGKMRQGASGLQRQHHDRRPTRWPATSAGTIWRSSPSRR